MLSIKKLPSGFYALYNGDVLADAALVEWDGKRGTEYPYTIDPNYCRYYIDSKNTVYYSVIKGGSGVWCSGSELNRHCHRLAQIAARR